MAAGFRIDQFLTASITTVISRLHPHAKTVMDAGGSDVVAAKLKEMGVTDRPVTLVDACRAAGFLGPDPSIIDVEVVNRKRTKRRVPRV